MAFNPGTRRDFLSVGSLGFLGLTLSEYLQAAAVKAPSAAKANSVILFWLEGGPSHIDTWDPKPNSNFKPISTNVAGIQVSELLPRIAKKMDKLALVRSMHTRGNDHPQATHYVITGHEINPAMQFPSLGSIVTKELGARNAVPPHVLVPKWDRGRQYEDYFRASFLGGDYDPMCIPDPSKPDFQVTDLSLPKTVSQASVESRSEFLKVVDRHYRKLSDTADHANVDAFTAQAWKMILTPAVRDAFDLSKESDKTKERYGKDAIGQSALLARQLVEAGKPFRSRRRGYLRQLVGLCHSDNDKIHRDKLTPPLDRTADGADRRSGRARLARHDARDRDGRVWADAGDQSQPGPRSLAELLVARAVGRRHQDGAGGWIDRREGLQRGQPRGLDGRSAGNTDL